MLADIIIIIVNEFLESPWHGPKCIYNYYLNPKPSPMEEVILFYQFYRWRSESLEKLGNLPKQVSSRIGILNPPSPCITVLSSFWCLYYWLNRICDNVQLFTFSFLSFPPNASFMTTQTNSWFLYYISSV